MKKLITTISAVTALFLSMQVLAQDMPDTITVTSSVFEHHGMVPEEYSAYGENMSIDLAWSNLPAGAVQLASICDDPTNPIPSLPPDWENISVLIPMTFPFVSTSGPPLFPGLIGASV